MQELDRKIGFRDLASSPASLVSLGRQCLAAGGVGCCPGVGAPELGAARFLKDPLRCLVSEGASFHLRTLQHGHTELASGTGAAAGASPGAGSAWPWVSPGQRCMARQAAPPGVVTVPSW